MSGVQSASWSPEDLYPQSTSYRSDQHFERHFSPGAAAAQRERSEAKLRAFYEPTGPPSNSHSRQVSAADSHTRGGPVAREHVFSNPADIKPNRLSKSNSTKKPRKLDFAHLLPHHKAAQDRLLSPSRVSHSPTAMTDMSEPVPRASSNFLRSLTPAGSKRSSFNARPVSLKSVATHRSQPFENDMQTKTHVRQPPKGIQNWFDAFESSDDEDKKVVQPRLGHHELPAADVPASALSETARRPSKKKRQTASIKDVGVSIERAYEQMKIRGRNNSITSTDFNVTAPPRQVAKVNRDSRVVIHLRSQQSILSISSSASEGANEPESASVWEQSTSQETPRESQFPAPPKAQDSRVTSLIDYDSNARDSMRSTLTSGSTPVAQFGLSHAKDFSRNLDEDVQYMPRNASQPMRRLHNLSMVSKATGTTFQDVTPPTPTSAAHIMAVTEEEKALLDMMRQKRAAMQQISFTEGYTTALQRSQPRRRPSVRSSIHSSENDEETYSTQTSEDSTLPTSYSDRELRRQLSMIRNQGVDEALKMERYLGTQECFSPPPIMPIELPTTKPKDQSFASITDSTVRQRSTLKSFLPEDMDSNAAAPKSKSPSPNDDTRHTPATVKKARRQSKFSATPSNTIKDGPVAFKTFQRNASKLHHGRPHMKERSPVHRDIIVASRSEPDIVSPPHPLPRTKSFDHIREPTRPLYEDLRTLQLLTNTIASSPTGSASPASPLSSLISATAPTTVPQPLPTSHHHHHHHHHHHGGGGTRAAANVPKTPNTDILRGSKHATKKKAPALRILDDGLDPRASRFSVTSASEEILAAWADLGGASEAYHGPGGY